MHSSKPDSDSSSLRLFFDMPKISLLSVGLSRFMKRSVGHEEFLSKPKYLLITFCGSVDVSVWPFF